MQMMLIQTLRKRDGIGYDGQTRLTVYHNVEMAAMPTAFATQFIRLIVTAENTEADGR